MLKEPLRNVKLFDGYRVNQTRWNWVLFFGCWILIPDYPREYKVFR